MLPDSLGIGFGSSVAQTGAKPRQSLDRVSHAPPDEYALLRCGAQPWLLAGKMIDAALRNGLCKQIDPRSKFFKSIVKNGLSFPPTPD